MLLNAMNATGAEAADTVMIGDTTYDVEMARNAGTLAIGVAWGYHDGPDLQTAGASVVVEDRAELFAAVHDLLDDR
jgi:phosphoglycolate phosphatase